MWVKRRVFVDLADRVQCETKYLAKPVVAFPALNVLRKQLQDIFFEKHGLNIFRKR